MKHLLLLIPLLFFAGDMNAAEYKTDNFIVTCTDAELAQQIGDAAEHFRKQHAQDWLGAELPKWYAPCPVSVNQGNIGAGGATTFSFDQGHVFGWQMNVQGTPQRLLDSVVPHEVLHTVFASHFRRMVPRWADEGACTYCESESERNRNRLIALEEMQPGEMIPIQTLLTLPEYPKDARKVALFYSQSALLSEFLIDMKGKPEFVAFLQSYFRHPNWLAAFRKHYGQSPEQAYASAVQVNRPSLAYMCETYGGKAFSLKWSPNHIKVIDRIEQSAIHGIDFAFAMPRGSGKTTIARWGVIWAILNGLSPYTVLVGASQKSADRLIKNIKSTLRFNQLLLEDYPEVCLPIRHIKGEARRAPGQKFQGEPTMIEWGKSQIVLAMIPVDYAQANSSIVDVTGIEGELRGRQFERMDGSIARPTLVLLDDPQTRESAKSPPQCKDREDIITADIKMMAGPDDQLGIVIPCTKIKNGDLACRLLDRETHPEFHGETTRMLESFPDDLKLWEEYRAIQVESLVNGGDGREATDFYKKHRMAMDKGAVASWPERFKTKNGEISAIQHAMNQYLTNEETFYAECQNDPQDGQDESVSSLNSDDLAKRMINLKRGVAPADATMLTSFIDLSKKVLWYMVCAWAEDFTGTIIDYGVWPDQKTRYTTLASARITMQMKKPGTGLEAALLNGLEELTLQLLDREWRSEAGGVLRIGKGLIDEGWEQKVVYDFCRRSKHASILLPSKGVGIKTRELNDPSTRPKPGEKRGDHWRINPSKTLIRAAVYDTDWWKTFMANRFAVDKNDSGAMTIYQVKTAAVQHRMLLEQLTAEYGSDVTYESAGKTRTHWSLKVGLFDNHFWDCLVGCAVAASMQGATLKGLIPEAHDKPKKKRTRKSMSERQRERRALNG